MRIQFWHIVVLLLIVLILFGAKRLPDVASSVGKSLKIFKKEVTELRDGEPDAMPTTTTTPYGTTTHTTAPTAYPAQPPGTNGYPAQPPSTTAYPPTAQPSPTPPTAAYPPVGSQPPLVTPPDADPRR
ncbi:twin-arginine translocase TatA/TatE family subunit [Georgenia faecalis]|uniref:Sec-independent protein translocase protein TatA n=1 Tax=Georgenia faecalis TaxID=2483799 RepID=A0ABV9DB76_9MICO|nr:twin-arginine translocase TatA/TatE family subunit [Georgenia faecalis]